jgi:hypothetical protein
MVIKTDYSGTALQVHHTIRRRVTSDCTSHRFCLKLPKLVSHIRRLQIAIFNVGVSTSVPTGQAIILSYTYAILL